MQRILLKILIVLGACALAVTCGEILLRIVGPHWLLAHMRELGAGHAVLGETSAFEFIESEGRHVTGFRPRSTFVLEDREFRTEVHITEWGTRVTGADAAGRDTIVFLGDSFAFGFGVNDVETFVSRTCRARGAACLDAAFPGGTLSTELDVVDRRYDLWGRPRRLVFVFFAGNDLPELVADRAQHPDAPRARPAGQGALLAVNDTISGSRVLRRSYALQLLKAAARARLTPELMDPMFVTASGARGAFGDRASAAVDAELNRLEATVSRLGVQASFVMLPDRFQVYPAAMADKARYYGLDSRQLDMLFPQRMLAAQLDRRGIGWLDVLPCLDPADDALYYTIDNHLTAHGHEVVARCILKSPTILL